MSGAVKCWGNNADGVLGLGDLGGRGRKPGEMGDRLPVVDLGVGRRAISVSPGGAHTCVVLDDGSVRCWGRNRDGQLGLGDVAPRGGRGGEMGDSLPTVDLGTGRHATSVTAGGANHTCALLDNGAVKCWGANDVGQLGLGDTRDRGKKPGEMGDSLPSVKLGVGRRAINVAAGTHSTCALLDDGSIKCWGDNHEGVLGLGDTKARGDQPSEMGDALPTVDLGTGRHASSVVAGHFFACALLDDGSVKCWGSSDSGQLGLGDTNDRGDQAGEMGDRLAPVDLGTGRHAISVAAGSHHTCALLDDGAVKCWGFNVCGELGIGDKKNRGERLGEMGDNLPGVDVGTGCSVTSVATGSFHTCALLGDGSVKCWGCGGALGQGDFEDRGDEPAEMGDYLRAVDLAF